MSEREEQSGEFTVSFPNGEFLATRDNTSLFTHMGRLALYDHVFFQRGEDSGTYLFNVAEPYTTIMTHMLENNFPAHINLQEVAECDRVAFDKMIHKEAAHDFEEVDGVPDDWLK